MYAQYSDPVVQGGCCMASIKEVSEQFNMTQDTLRYYERIGLLPPVHRNLNGIRNYQEEDIKWVEFVKCMRGSGLSIEALIEYVTMFQDGETTLAARKLLLMNQRDLLVKRMEDMKSTIERLNKKIDGYETMMVSCEEKLQKK